MPLYECSVCQRVFHDTCITTVLNIKDVPNGQRPPMAGKQTWWDTGARKQNAIFLTEPPRDPQGKHTCGIMDLRFFDTLDDFNRSRPPKPKPSLADVAETGIVLSKAVPSLVTVHLPPAWQFPAVMPVYNDLRTYGAGTCKLCNRGNCHAIGESAHTRFMALQVHQYMRTARDSKASLSFMIGVAINHVTGVVAVAFSSNSSGADAHLHGCTVTGLALKIYGKEAVNIETCRGGRKITDYVHLSRTVVGDGARDTSSCAASKLIKKYIKDSELTQWSMTELTYGKIAGNNYIDGESAPSCGGCEAFLPTLLCDKKKLL
jgi:hypothetical protein